MVRSIINLESGKANNPRYSVVLPGPNRKRQPGEYAYRVIYRCDDPQAVGCLASWEVTGGREPYQISLEQKPVDWRVWHCTCADAIYRAEPLGRVCKHVIGLPAFGPPISESA